MTTKRISALPPKSERERIREVLAEHGSISISNLLDPDVFYATVARAGLRLVDK